METNQNPKYVQAQKEGKIPFEYLIYEVLAGDARIHKGGADKYGERNWRKDPITASTYEGAIMRHFTAWARGENEDPDSGESHLYHIRACCAILLDSEMHGTLIDDRDRMESKTPPALRTPILPRERIEELLNPTTPADGVYVAGNDDEEGPWEIRFTESNAAAQIVDQNTRGPYETIGAAKLDALANPWNLPGNISIHKSPLTIRKDNA